MFRFHSPHFSNTGDSAGGNLITGLTIKCLELGIRPADGLFLAYTPFIFELIPSPARLLAVMDPMLPLGFALRCLKGVYFIGM